MYYNCLGHSYETSSESAQQNFNIYLFENFSYKKLMEDNTSSLSNFT